MCHPWFPWSVWGNAGGSLKAGNGLGPPLLKDHLVFSWGDTSAEVSAEEQWLGFGVGQPEIQVRDQAAGAASPHGTSHRVALARLEGVQCPPGWAQAALPSRGSPASHM